MRALLAPTTTTHATGIASIPCACVTSRAALA